jgi:hypothetical protein
MRDFLSVEIFGINGLVNISNLMFLVALCVRDVLWLRIISIASYFVILPYYYYHSEPLWPSIFWAMAFIIANGIRIALLVLERRPVVFSEQEEELYRIAFSSMDRREFLKLASLVQWVDCPPGYIIIKKGEKISDAMVLVSGEVDAILDARPQFQLRAGQLIGDVTTYSGLASPGNVVARGPARLAKWDLEKLRAFAEDKPELRAKLLNIESADLAGKLRSLAGI